MKSIFKKIIQQPIFKSLQSAKSFYHILSITTVLFLINYHLMATMPGDFNNSCMLGAALTPKNIIFSLVLSFISAALFINIGQLIKKEQNKHNVKIASLSGLGLITGTLTIFCTFCALPVISLLGVSLTSLFTTYNTAFQLISLALLIISGYFLNKQLKGECQLCKVNTPK